MQLIQYVSDRLFKVPETETAWAAGHNFLCVDYNGQKGNFCHLGEVILRFLITKLKQIWQINYKSYYTDVLIALYILSQKIICSQIIIKQENWDQQVSINNPP